MSDQIIFLFGAGASKGATHVSPAAPPLGRELYDELSKRFPKEWGVESRLYQYADSFRRNFEKTMSEEVCGWQPTLNILEWHQKMALYFSEFTLDRTGEDLYSSLIECLQRSGRLAQASFGSLNYECLFEQAAHSMGYQVGYECDQSTRDSIRVLKVHGSCNFVTQDLRDWRAQLTTPYSHLECEIECLIPAGIQDALISKFSNPSAYYYPVMSLYSSSKDSLLAPVGIQRIRNKWRECVLGAALVVTVGVRPTKADTHVWGPMLETRARCVYIGSKRDLGDWPEAHNKIEFFAKSFESGFIRLQELLRC